ncbi:MAG: hypothetical protein Q8865_03955 [Bacillota bacterium]|nr:hypothetical protein [Bacillota bacterium]
MFTKDSALVKIWVRNIDEGNYTREQVPNLSNLQAIVYEILDNK